MSDVLERVRLANPITDLDALDDAEYTRALAEIENRWEFGTAPQNPTAARSGWLRPVLIAASSAVLIVLAIAVPILFMRGDRQPVTDTTAPSPTTTTAAVTTTEMAATTTAPTTTTTGTLGPVAAPPDVSWSRLPGTPQFEDAWMKAVAVGEDSLVIAGGTGPHEIGWPTDAAVWYSNDGLTWEAVQEASFLGNDPDAGEPWGATVWDIATGPLGFAAGGHHGTSAAIWVSPGGQEWTRTLDDPASDVIGISTGGPGWVAVGDADEDAGVWVSGDGLDWTRIEDDDLLAADRGSATVYDVEEWSGGLIGVGKVGLWDGTGDRAGRGAVWVSEDGYEWVEMQHASFDEAKQFEAVSVDPETGTVFAFGWGGIWTSTDGIEWEHSTWDGSFGGPPAGSGAAWDGNRVVAGGPDMALSLWISDDRGATWHRVDPDDPAFDGYNPGVDDVALFGDRFVVVGAAGDYTQEVGAIWIGTWDE
ncbi:MAG: sialidase family protein [Actinomycetota bacterium]